MTAILLFLGIIITPLLASNQIHPIYLISECDQTLKPHQAVIINFLHEKGIDIGDTAIDVAQTKALELVEADILEKFPDEAYRQNKILEILLNESGAISHDTLLQTQKYVKELIDYISEKLQLFSSSYDTFMPSSYDEYRKIRMDNIAIASIHKIYGDKFYALFKLTSFAGLRAKRLKRLDYYHQFILTRTFDQENPKQVYYDFLKDCGVQNPEALGDFS